MNQKTGFRLAFITICLLLLSSCVTLNDPESSQEFRSHLIAEITPEHDFGQTFKSRRPKFNRVQVWLQIPQQSSNSDFQIIASLYHRPDDTQPLGRVLISKKEMEGKFPLSISFPAQENRPGVSYFLRLEITAGKVLVYGRDEDQNSSGEAWIGNEPQDSDAAFRLGYDYNLLDFFNDFVEQPLLIPYILCLFWLSWMPGRLSLLLAGVDRQFDWGERTAISIGISLAFYPILFVWTGILGFTWNQAWVWGMLISMAALSLYLVHRKRKDAVKNQPNYRNNTWIPIGLLSIFLVSLAVRLVMVRDLSAPAWVDSVHHALLGRLIVLNGGLPGSYSPFVEVQTSNYHVGFHVVLALFQWLSQLDISKALLIFGQVLNALMVFSTYLFTNALVKNSYAGLGAAFITGLVTPMPAYYTSWGRYTQLAGLVILPAAIAILYPMIEANEHQPAPFSITIRKRDTLAKICLLSILFAGLFLSHYRVFAFGIILVLVISGMALFFWYKQKKIAQNSLRYLYIIAPIALFTILFLIPWLPETIRTLFLPSLVWSQSASTKPFGDFSWNLLTSARGIYSLVIAAAGIIWAMFQRRAFVWILCVWIIILFLLANLNVWGLPGANFINNTSIVISLFLPISLFCGYLISWLLIGWYHWMPARFTKLYITGIIIVSLLLGLITSKPLLTIVNPTTLLFRESDRPALTWIRDNIPSDEVIFINPFAWGYGLYAGSDGGFWISPLSEKPTLPPPVLYGLDLLNLREINLMSNQVIQSNGDPQTVYDLMIENQIHYLYIGAKGGLISPSKIQQNQNFQVIYHNQTTWVFKIRE